jgi:transposase InsO family protein
MPRATPAEWLQTILELRQTRMTGARIAGLIGHRITGDRRRRIVGAGWEYVHVAVDDATRLAYVEVLRDETVITSVGFLRRAFLWFARLGVQVERILTDNGSGYRSRRFAAACEGLRVRHKRTRPYRPCTNGKAERFIQTLLREWAYAMPYRNSSLRIRALRPWLRYYNCERAHGSLAGLPRFSRLKAGSEQRVWTSQLGGGLHADHGCGGPDCERRAAYLRFTSAFQFSTTCVPETDSRPEGAARRKRWASAVTA